MKRLVAMIVMVMMAVGTIGALEADAGCRGKKVRTRSGCHPVLRVVSAPVRVLVNRRCRGRRCSAKTPVQAPTPAPVQAPVQK